MILDEQGRYRAQQVMYLKASQTKTAKTKTKTSGRSQQEKLQPMQVASVAYILVLAGLGLAGLLSGMILLLVSLMNVSVTGCMPRIRKRHNWAIAVFQKIPCIWWHF